MTDITKIISGMGILIAIYLFVVNSKGVGTVLSSAGSQTVQTIKTLQGR